MATDAYGLSDFSMLSAPQQETARNINEAFTASMAARDRNLQRYAMAAPSAPMMAELANESALKQAQFSANILNQNQQLQNLIDASHATPHGFAQNLAAYLPMLGAAQYALPAIFGNSASLASNGGLVGLAGKGINSVMNFVHPVTGQSYGLDASGNVIPPAQLGGNVDYGVPYGESPYMLNAPAGQVDLSAAAPAASDVGTGAITAPYDFGTPITDTSNIPSDIASFFG